MQGVVFYMNDNGGRFPIDYMYERGTATGSGGYWLVGYRNQRIGAYQDWSDNNRMRGPQYTFMDPTKYSGTVWCCPFAGEGGSDIIAPAAITANYCQYGFNSYAIARSGQNVTINWNNPDYYGYIAQGVPSLIQQPENADGSYDWSSDTLTVPYNLKPGRFRKKTFPLISDTSLTPNWGGGFTFWGWFNEHYDGAQGTWQYWAPWPIDRNPANPTYGKAIFHNRVVNYAFTDGHGESNPGFTTIAAYKRYLDPWMP